MDQRRAFVREYARDRLSMTELCELYGVSRKTGYKWMARHEAEGAAGLVERSRRPHQIPRATDATVVQLLCDARRRHPTWSARKLLKILRGEHADLAWPSRSTGCALLKAQGLIRQRRVRTRARAAAGPLVAAAAPNDLWTTDFKGEFRTGDGRYCYPLTLRDGFSRFVLRCDGLATKRGLVVREQFERAFREFGLPTRIRSDNGWPFAGTGLLRLSQLSVYWMELGIYPERIALGHPEQNGSHEQFHRVLKAETTRPPAPTRGAQQQRFRRFCQEYNEVRPHEALQDRTPAQCYEPSRRPLPSRLPSIEYPGHMEVRRISPNGQLSWRGVSVHLTEMLAGRWVGLDEVAEGLWIVHFSRFRLARFDERERTWLAVTQER